VAFVAGQERHCKAESCLDYAALAAFPGTLVFYMGVTRAADWSGALIARGKPSDTPVAIIRRCTWRQQQMIRCTLGTVAETIHEHGLRPPAVFVVGKVVDRAPQRSWFAADPSPATEETGAPLETLSRCDTPKKNA
jgi:uroporphyrinogen III methyltransferase/synthase